VTEASNVFLRWARLKQETKAAQQSEAAPANAEAAQRRPDAANSGPFDLASLPSIDSIVAGTDITGFLRSGVPAELTRAALRRAWASDPAIRDFVGIADNQWDFNDPNGIPGFGPLGAMQGQAAFRALASPPLPTVLDLPSEDETNAVLQDPKSVQPGQPAADQPGLSAHQQSVTMLDDTMPPGEPAVPF
jgi:hypothetical protein